MNDYQDTPSEYASTEQPQARPSWFKRNWLWFIPTVIILPLLCCCGGGIGLVYFGISQTFELQPYKDSISLIEQDPDVQNALGTPIDTPEGFGDLVTMMQNGGKFDLVQSGSTMIFDAQFVASGPNGTGTVFIEAESSDGGITWTYSVRELHVDQTGEVIDLLGAGSGAAPDVASDDTAESDSE